MLSPPVTGRYVQLNPIEWNQGILNGSIESLHQIEKKENLNSSYVRRTLRLAFLSLFPPRLPCLEVTRKPSMSYSGGSSGSDRFQSAEVGRTDEFLSL